MSSEISIHIGARRQEHFSLLPVKSNILVSIVLKGSIFSCGESMVAKKIPDKDKTIFTAAEACGYINLCWNSLKKLIDDGDIAVVRVGKRYLIPKESIDKFMNKDTLLAESIAKSICL